jgi:hypothetical protein
MILLTFNNTDQRLIASLGAKGEKISVSLQQEMDRILADILLRVQAKLSGEVLQTRTGNLLKSARIEQKATVEGKSIKGTVSVGAGLAQAYAAVQEYGGRRQYDIIPRAKKALAFFQTGSPGSAVGSYLITRNKKTGASYVGTPVAPGPSYLKGLTFRFKTGAQRGSLKKGKVSEFSGLGGIVVRRVVHPPLPERSYMRQTLKEMSEEILQRVRGAIVRGLEE